MSKYQLAVCRNCQNLHAKWGSGTPAECAVCGHNNLRRLSLEDFAD